MPQDAKIRVMIVEDSRVVRELLAHIISQDPRLKVVSAVESGEQAVEALNDVAPDVITMDIRLPGMNGMEATQLIMEQRPTPIVVVSGNVDDEELKISINALRAGALSVVEKPVNPTHEAYAVMAAQLCTRLAIMSQVKVIRQRSGRSKSHLARTPFPPAELPAFAAPSRFAPAGPIRVVAIAASTGGPRALEQLLRALPAEFPVAIALVQHITASFHRGFVSWLNDLSPIPAVTAEHGQPMKAGRVYVAPADGHLCVRGRYFWIDHGPPVSMQRPSASVLFESIAQSVGEQALGVILTGMGDDGATGLLAMRQRGAYTIAEDESTAIVYGMPAVAVRLGAVCDLLPLNRIAQRVTALVRSHSQGVRQS